VSWSASSRQLWIADLLVLPNQLKVILQRLVTGGGKGGRKPSELFPESRAFGLLDESAALGETRRNRRGNGTEGGERMRKGLDRLRKLMATIL
jgi:hypothetical protein